MARVRQRDTKPELVTRRTLHALGYRFRLHVKGMPGTPDIVLKRHRAVVLVHGCFWHGHGGCSRSALPETNHDWWQAKIDGNHTRDLRTLKDLEDLGWRVLVVWECETHDKDALRRTLADFMAPGASGA